MFLHRWYNAGMFFRHWRHLDVFPPLVTLKFFLSLYDTGMFSRSLWLLFVFPPLVTLELFPRPAWHLQVFPPLTTLHTFFFFDFLSSLSCFSRWYIFSFHRRSVRSRGSSRCHKCYNKEPDGPACSTKDPEWSRMHGCVIQCCMGGTNRDLSMVGTSFTGVQDSTHRRVPHHRELYDKGQKKLPSTLLPDDGLWFYV